MVGDPAQPRSAEIIRLYGGSAASFSARQITAPILREQDLVLTMDSGHRTEVLHVSPALLRRTFTIREFARMLDVLEERDADNLGDGSTNWRNLASRAAAVRHLALARMSGEDDVVDPYRRGPEVYEQMENELAPAVEGILRFSRFISP